MLKMKIVRKVKNPERFECDMEQIISDVLKNKKRKKSISNFDIVDQILYFLRKFK